MLCQIEDSAHTEIYKESSLLNVTGNYSSQWTKKKNFHKVKKEKVPGHP